MKRKRIGMKFTTKEGFDCEIIEYYDAHNCIVKFDNGYITKAEFKQVNNGVIKNPYYKSVYDVGYFGEGRYSKLIHTNIYNAWNNMLRRCYFEEYHLKHPTYIGCSISKEWHNFQVFAKWYEENYVEGFDLDKDILFKRNKLYSPETCCFVPPEINTLFTKNNSKRAELPLGVRKHHNKFTARISKGNKNIYLGLFNTVEEAFEAYKTAKEIYIKELADKWKGYLTKECYKALYNYKVETDD